MSEEFISEPIAVAEGNGVEGPLRFTWRGKEYETEALESAWQDHGQPPGTHKGNWRTRRHRNYFTVRTVSGERFRIYLDRGAKGDGRTWILDRHLPGGGEEE